MAYRYPILDQLYEWAASNDVGANHMRTAIVGILVPPCEGQDTTRRRVFKVLGNSDQNAELSSIELEYLHTTLNGLESGKYKISEQGVLVATADATVIQLKIPVAPLTTASCLPDRFPKTPGSTRGFRNYAEFMRCRIIPGSD